jgi:chromosome partitioning protein
MQCEYYALEGLTALLDTIEGVRARGNPELAVEGLLRTMSDPRNSLTRDVSRQLIQYFGDKVYRTVVPRNVRLAEAPSHGLPALLYDRHSRGAVAYLALAGEIRRKNGEAA